ncbi:a-pheromone processing metallopeptidase Ste23 [Tothia fuscella]|uniref:A-pheromone processing metallopeptidase Ste23 n=1 Tax=Tothia fuscella TaxID=1048955 RepID=A0A9P4P4B9_9PEZI|nr:a-pheromone processing metallopeptidase Ste23 [Tothia fuscella]
MERPALDDRSYRVIRLPNQLEALLIHDADTDKASGALDVNVGSFSDATDMPGLAHAVEHMLFMGTEKYPLENEYNQYLTAHSGYSNAYTASTSTNYYFEVAASSTHHDSKSTTPASTLEDLTLDSQPPLYGALDRFAQFFVKPLFLEDTLDRELRAVDSENKKNLQSDNWRLHQLNKSLSNPEHPFCHFSTGNYETLHDKPIARGVKIRDEFIGFYQKHYSANRMKLVVLGRESLDQLQQWVEELFSDIEDKNLPRNRWDDVAPYTSNELGKQVFAKPVFDMRVLDIYFPYPDEEELYESQPGRYLSHLIGHEGPGSILSYIKNKGWANGLGAGPAPLCPGSAFFSISVKLTEEGLKNYQTLVEVIFQYIAMLKETPPQHWIFEEMKKMSEVDFRFRQKSPASKTTSALSAVMQKTYPRDCLLSGPALIRKFNPDAINRGLECLRPDNFRMTIVSQDYPGAWDKKEQWYGTEYNYDNIPPSLMERIHRAAKATPADRPTELHLPHKNEFIPTRLEVDRKDVLEPLKHPKLIRNDEHVRTWWKKDDRFWVPKANVHITLRSPLASISPHAGAMAQIYQGLVQDALVEYSYAADISGLEYQLIGHSLGMDVSVSGYNDKMAVLLEKLLISMRDLEVDSGRFKIIKERLLRGYKNVEFQQPYHQIGTYSRWINNEKGWINEQLLAELPNITEADVRIFYPQLLHQLHIEVLAHGNLYREDALRYTDLVESTLRPRKLPSSQWPIRRTLIIPPGSNYLYERPLKDPANVNHCIEYMLYLGNNQDRQLRAKALLFAQIADEPCFDQLRTKEQLGYVVFNGTTQHNTWLGYRVLIQSEKTPEYLESRIDSFLTNLLVELNDMSEHKFQKHKRSLINKRLERLKNLSQETGRFWNHIVGENFDFEQVTHDVDHIEPLTKNDLIAFYNKFISPGSSVRAKIAVHLVAQSVPAAVIEEPNANPEAKFQLVMTALSQFFDANRVPANPEQLARRLKGVDVNSTDPAAFIGAVKLYLTEDARVPDLQAQQIVEHGMLMMKAAMPAEGSEQAESNATTKPVRIEDVRAFKGSLQLSPGPRPAKNLVEFEDFEAKL